MESTLVAATVHSAAEQVGYQSLNLNRDRRRKRGGWETTQQAR